MSRTKSRKPSFVSGLMNRAGIWFHGTSARCTLFIALGALILFVLFSIVCVSDRYSLEVGDIAPQTITATKEVVDTVTTEKLKDEAASKAPISYRPEAEVNDAVKASLTLTLDEFRKVQQYGQTLLLSADESVSQDDVLTAECIAYAQNELVKSFEISEAQARQLLTMSEGKFDMLHEALMSAFEQEYSKTVDKADIKEVTDDIRAQCRLAVGSDLTRILAEPMLEKYLRANKVVDLETTERARQLARDNVEPVIYKQGRNIVSKGNVVEEHHLAMLSDLGLLDSAGYDYAIFGGALLLIAGSVFLLVLLIRIFAPETFNDVRSIIVIMLVLIICTSLGVICAKLINVYLAPIAFAAMLLTCLYGAKIGISGGITAAVIISGLAAASSSNFSSETIHLLLTGVVSTALAVHFLSGKAQRVRTVICGVLVAFTNLILIISVGMMTVTDLHSTVEDAVWSMASGILSGLIAVGFTPVFEAAFNLATPGKLLELANPNQPLLRRLQMEAPGTYHHSIVVANLAEAASERIGANPLLARTGAYFHDIGKLKRPLYFKENQRGENPHDQTDAYVSAAIVTSHTSDGLQLAQKHHLPPEIQRIIIEHHGDTPVMYFYHKALQQADGKPVDVKDFRYNGNRPTSKESAIVMLADTIEAAVRSMSDPTPQAIQKFIERLIRGKLEDGQLSSSPLTLHDIDGISEAFSKVLSGVFHERIEYPTVQLNTAGSAVAVNAPMPSAAAAEDAAKLSEAEEMPEPYNAPMPDDDMITETSPRSESLPQEEAEEE